MAMQGSGTEIDPWQITLIGELTSTLRNASESGFYRIMNDLDTGSYYGLTPITITVAAGYSPKVIDGNGYTVRFSGSQPTSNTCCVFAGVHFKNIKIHASIGMGGSYTLYLNYRCSLTDVAFYAGVNTNFAVNTYLVHSDANTPFLIARDMRRVTLFKEGSPASVVSYFLTMSLSGVSASQMYVYTTASVSAGLTKRTVPLTLADLNGLTANAFSDNGWWQSGVEMLPLQSEQVALTLQTIAGGAAASRRLWLENERYTNYIGDSDVEGLAQFNVRIRKWSSFTIYASEDFAADELRDGKLIQAGAWYLPPTDNGYVYQADVGGRTTSLAGVTFADQPVTVDGILFTPRPVYKAVLSERSSVLRDGSAQTIVLDNAGGGGGPVIEGDPAYLDGVVEEIHPMLGTVRALANAEVLAFERRGTEYVPMGSAYSNAVGEFRVETEVYGGGDIFAFAADFPGVIWQAGIALNTGDRVRPTVNNGYVYEVVTPGNSGATEPQWWADTGDGTEGAIGGATAKARPYYQPVGHGPLKMTLVEP